MVVSRKEDLGDNFTISGPVHMMLKAGSGSSPTTAIAIDWDNDEHRRCVAASIVKGTYVLDNDRAKHGQRTKQGLAPAWWKSFHFDLVEVLKSDQFTFGAIFRYAPPAGMCGHPSAPCYVVAFRGTMLHYRSITGAVDDLCLDAKIVVNWQHDSFRFSEARRKVTELLDSIGNNNANCGSVWLTGHSLGASLALDVGRTMMEQQGRNLPTFLFNPPQVSLEPAIVALPMSEKARNDLHIMINMAKLAFAKIFVKDHIPSKAEVFEQLSPWTPNLYVHDRDIICKGFIGYFEQQDHHQKQEWLFPGMADLMSSAALLSCHDMCQSMLGKENARSHLLPSARLCKNTSSEGNPYELRQWWQPELILSSRLYRWPCSL